VAGAEMESHKIPIHHRAVGGALATFPHPSNLQRINPHLNLADSHRHMLGVAGPVLQRSPKDSLGAKSIDYSVWATPPPFRKNAMIRLSRTDFLQFSPERSPKIS
jgi:hypothetical protein